MRKDVRDVAELIIVDILADGSQKLVFGDLNRSTALALSIGLYASAGVTSPTQIDKRGGVDLDPLLYCTSTS